MLNQREVFFKWLGSKRKLASEIISMFPKHNGYCEVFGGAGNILLRKEPSKHEIFNDIDSDIISIYLAVQYQFHEFARRVKYSISDRNYFEFLLNYPIEHPSIDKAVRAFYLIENSFCGKRKHFAISSKTIARDRKGLLKLLLKIHKRIEKVTFENLDFGEFINKYDREDVLFFLDPPYMKKKDDYQHNNVDYIKLERCLKDVKGKFVLTVCDSNENRKLFKDYNCKEIEVCYTSASNNNNIKDKELIFTNF